MFSRWEMSEVRTESWGRLRFAGRAGVGGWGCTCVEVEERSVEGPLVGVGFGGLEKSGLQSGWLQ